MQKERKTEEDRVCGCAGGGRGFEDVMHGKATGSVCVQLCFCREACLLQSVCVDLFRRVRAPLGPPPHTHTHLCSQCLEQLAACGVCIV